MGSQNFEASSLGTIFKQLDPKDQRGIFFCLSLAGFVEHYIEGDFVPIIEDIVDTTCIGDVGKKIILELATAILASCDFPDDKAFADLFGRDPDMLRGITIMLMLAESNDPSKAREKIPYSRKRDEARVQVVSEILRLLGVKDKQITIQLNGVELTRKWNELSAALVPGALAGMKSMSQAAIIGASLKRIGFLSSWSNTVLQEYIKIIT